MNFVVVTQLVLGLLSLPLVTALGAWIVTRFSKERRLQLEVERRGHIYSNLPDGPAKEEFAERLNDSLRALNARLDPLFKKERRRKRTVVFWAGIFAAALTAVGSAASLPAESVGNVAGLVLGAFMVGAFFFIERDTKRQRLALRRARSLEAD
jgi:hypothetical protein